MGIGQIELNEGLARAMAKPGEPGRNPVGHKLPHGVMARNRLLKEALLGELRKQCEYEGFTHLTKFEFGVRKIVELWQEGDRWACTWLANRIWGRVPTTVELQLQANLEVHHTIEMEELSDVELLRRLDMVREVLTEELSEVVDAEVTNAHPPVGGTERGED